MAKEIKEIEKGEVHQLERERLNRLAKETSVILKKIPTEEFAESIRASRDNR